MSTVNTTGYKAFTATAVAIAKNVRVLLDSSGTISAAGVSDEWIGTTIEDIAASGTGVVRLRNAPGTHFFTASAAVTRGAKLYAAAAGKVDDGSTVLGGGANIGFEALEAATADGDIIECAPTSENAGGTPVIFNLPITLANVANGDVLTTWTPGFAGKIVSLNFAVTTAVTTAAKAATLNAEIGTTDLTGGTVALTSANCTPLGVIVAGAAITAANTFTATDTVSIEASSVTAFSEGAGILIITVRAL
jgi:hypothetical protein